MALFWYGLSINSIEHKIVLYELYYMTRHINWFSNTAKSGMSMDTVNKMSKRHKVYNTASYCLLI